MTLKLWKCELCGLERRTFKKEPTCDHIQEGDAVVIGAMPTAMVELLVAPTTTFMEKRDPESDKSVLVGQNKILKERSRAHSRDHDLDELIQNNPRTDSVKNNWVNDEGVPRKKIDDL